MLQKNFSLQQEISINDIQSRLALLTRHFTKLRIIWCQSSHGTANLFRDLKRNTAQPDVEKAATITSNDALNRDTKYNTASHDALMKLPCVSTKNVALLADNVPSIQHLAAFNKTQIGDVLSNQRFGETILSFFNTEYTPEKSEPAKAIHTATKNTFSKGKSNKNVR